MTKPEHLRFNTWFGSNARDILVKAGMPEKEVLRWTDQLYDLAERLWDKAREDGEQHGHDAGSVVVNSETGLMGYNRPKGVK